ncbi:RING-type E3 ubiquitin transferase [Quillaja saponaria]|uniref:RING-type E3 ubiquitin transferase n=1 Tax=Quillaja saponaria TaxID=32244 RepID=A0AAD7PLQ3_QUISA|nr:RING-type E3 ubiquitin transferase [Quillaja saponaria]
MTQSPPTISSPPSSAKKLHQQTFLFFSICLNLDCSLVQIYSSTIRSALKARSCPALFILKLNKFAIPGSESTKTDMAETLSEIELTDQNKLYLIQTGALDPLLQLLKNGRIQIKKVAGKALLQLSILPQIGLHMIREGVVGPLFELLYRHSSQTSTLRKWVAPTIMHLAISTTVQEAEEEQVTFLESEEDIFKFFSLISLTGPDIPTSILKAFYAMCQSPSGLDIRMKLSQLSAVRVLVQLCEVDNKVVRPNAVKLFFCLTEARDDSSFSEHAGQECIENFLRIIETTNDVEEIGAAMGIVSKLPKDPQITQLLLDSGALETIFACLTDGNRHTGQILRLQRMLSKLFAVLLSQQLWNGRRW